MARARSRHCVQRHIAAATLWTAAGLVTALLSWSSTQAFLQASGHAVSRPPQAASAPIAPAPAMGEKAAPAAGVTGTTALPAPPSFADRAAVEPVAAAARPFALTGVGAIDRARALECLTAVVYYEAASEGDDGQRAVAQVVLNRVRHPAFPATVCGVVYQGSERRGCQFSFACDGSTARGPNRSGWARAARNAAAALAGGVYAPVGLATHYHTFAVTPAWNRSLVMTGAVGAHLFHRWRGWWGTGAAFAQRYRGGEPAPGPHVTIVVEAAAAAPPTPAPLPVRPVLPVEPAPAPPVEDRLPPAPEVLERWRDAGRPLR